MDRWFKYGIVVAGIGVLAVIAAGCGDDNKGSSSSTLTTEDQYNEINKYFAFDPDSTTSSQVNVTAFVLGLFSPQYLDGVDPEDIGGQAKHMPLLAVPAGVDHDSLYYDYNVVTGWWVVYYQLTTTDQDGTNELTSRDSVRFENAQGNPQVDPNQTTVRVKIYRHFAANLTATEGLAASSAQDHAELEATANSRFEVTLATPQDLQVDGDAGVTIDFQAHFGDTASADIGFAVDASYNQILIPIPDVAAEACPSDGDVTAGMIISIAVTSGDESASAEGSWDASVNFTGNGNATVNVESGDFSRQFTGQACNPNP